MTKFFTTGRVADKKRWVAAGWKAIDVTVKSSRKNAKQLAPTWEMVKSYLAGRLSAAEYTERYEEIIARSQQNAPELWNNTVERFDRVVFLCYCKPGDFCHRVLLAEAFVAWAQTMGKDVELVKETGFVPSP